ncbi:MAG TPA: molybdopterin-binding protein, partial [Tepidisphaeraceae bacterium]|nr:molybdopterin-binding protein [Tepidisphaeraceae bacterium]
MSHQEHEKCAASLALSCCVITLSDTRTKETDISGKAIIEQLTAAGHRVVRYELIPDEPEQLRSLVRGAIDDPAIEVVITTGGTGVAARLPKVWTN